MPQIVQVHVLELERDPRPNPEGFEPGHVRGDEHLVMLARELGQDRQRAALAACSALAALAALLAGTRHHEP